MLTLNELLRQLTPGDRATLLRRWGLTDGAPPASDTGALALALSQYWSVATVVDGLERESRSALWLVVTQPRSTLSLDTLLRSLETPGIAPLAGLRALLDLGLILAGPAAREIIDGKTAWEPGRTARGRLLTVPPEVAGTLLRIHQAQAAGDTSDRSLEAVIETFSVNELQSVARRWGIDRPHEIFRRDLATALLDRVQDAEAVQQVLAGLSTSARSVFDLLMAHDRRILAAAAVERLGATAVRSAWQELRPLLLLRDTWRDDRRWLYVPNEVARNEHGLRQGVALASTTPPQRTDDHGLAIVWDLITLVDFVAREPVRLTATSQRVPKRTQAEIQSLLTQQAGDAAAQRFDFLLHSAVRSGLIERQPLAYEAAAAAGAVLESGFASLLRLLFTGWRDDAGWYEPAGYEGMYWANARPAARRRLLRHLAEVEPGTWYRTVDLIQHVRSVDPHFMRARHDILRYRGARALNEAMETWEQVEGRLIRAVIEGPLLWLGVVALATGVAEEHRAWSVTRHGAWLLDPQRPAPTAGSGESVVVQPTFEVVAIDPTSATVHRLNQLADLVQADIAARYTISRESVLRAVNHGWSAPSITAFLEQVSRRPLPQNVRYSIVDWAGKRRSVSVRPVLLLEFDDPASVDTWLASAGAAEWGPERIGPTAVAISASQHGDEVTTALRLAGFQVRERPPADTAVGRRR